MSKRYKVLSWITLFGALVVAPLMCERACHDAPWLDRYQDQMSELPPGTWTPAWEVSDAD